MSSELLPGWTQFARRIAGAGRLQSATYRELSWDRGALPQAIAVILLSSLVSAIVFLVDRSEPGKSVVFDWGRYPIGRERHILDALLGAMLDRGWGLIVWATQATIIWMLWNRFGPNRKAWYSIAAPLGFATAPLIVVPLLELLPLIGGALGVIGLFWVLVASIVAVRVALNSGWGWAMLLIAGSMLILWPLSVGFSAMFD